MIKLLPCAFLTLTLLPLHLMAAPAAPTPAALTPLIKAISQRLEIANDVALSKWYSGKPVQDTDRERQVIASATAKAGDFRLSRDDASQFFAAQIEANKMVQYARLAQWHATGTAPANPAQSLGSDIRSRLDTLQPILLTSYAAFSPHRRDVACPDWVSAASELQATDPVMSSALARAVGDLCIPRKK